MKTDQNKLFYILFSQLFSNRKKKFSLSRANFSLPLLLNFEGICLQIFKNRIEQFQIHLTFTWFTCHITHIGLKHENNSGKYGNFSNCSNDKIEKKTFFLQIVQITKLKRKLFSNCSKYKIEKKTFFNRSNDKIEKKTFQIVQITKLERKLFQIVQMTKLKRKLFKLFKLQNWKENFFQIVQITKLKRKLFPNCSNDKIEKKTFQIVQITKLKKKLFSNCSNDKLLPPPLPVPALTVNQSSFALAWFLSWGDEERIPEKVWLIKFERKKVLLIKFERKKKFRWEYLKEHLRVEGVAGIEGVKKALVEFAPKIHPSLVLTTLALFLI